MRSGNEGERGRGRDGLDWMDGGTILYRFETLEQVDVLFLTWAALHEMLDLHMIVEYGRGLRWGDVMVERVVIS